MCDLQKLCYNLKQVEAIIKVNHHHLKGTVIHKFIVEHWNVLTFKHTHTTHARAHTVHQFRYMKCHTHTHTLHANVSSDNHTECLNAKPQYLMILSSKLDTPHICL